MRSITYNLRICITSVISVFGTDNVFYMDNDITWEYVG